MAIEYAAIITKVKPLAGLKALVLFKNRGSKVIDLEPYLKGPMFGAIRDDLDLFSQVSVSEGGGLEWPNGADICPDLLYHEGTPPWAKRFIETHKH